MAPQKKDDVQKLIKERFAQLPKVVQTAITSADIEKQLRELANTHKLHLDQWQTLENEVVMTLLGINPVAELRINIKKQLEVSDEIASALTEDISKIVFEPIRQELERELEHPSAKAVPVSEMETVRMQNLGTAAVPTVPAAPAVLPATPPAPGPTEKIQRAPVSESYKAGETSSGRKSVHDDPYREPPQ